MAKTSINNYTLPNGLQVVHLQTPQSNVGYFGVVIRAGACDETTPDSYGLAHFVEHTIFKGTVKRNSWHIINRMEAVGGELNAFTTKVDTVVYTMFPKGSLKRAAELVFDLVVNSQFPENEIITEREVVCDEINSYLDTPAEAVYDEFEDALYSRTPLGHNILGNEESVRRFSSGMCRGWLDKHYHADNMIVFYAGSTGPDAFLRTVTPLVEPVPVKKDVETARVNEDSVPAFNLVRNIDSHQAHTVMGCALKPADMKERITFSLITNILGGPGMNSKFNIALREKRGLVYSVESAISNWRSSSMFTTYFGSDPAYTERCIDLVRGIIEDMSRHPMSLRQLNAAKKQYHGQLVIARENPEGRILGVARAMLSNRPILTPGEAKRILDTISAEDIITAAERLKSLSQLTLSPR